MARLIAASADYAISQPKPAILACHPERSEGSGGGGAEMLRCAQHDNTDFGR